MATATAGGVGIPALRLGVALAHVGHAAKGGRGDAAGWMLLGGGLVEGVKPGLRIRVVLPEIEDLAPCMVSHDRLSAIVRESRADVVLAAAEGQIGVRAGKGGRWTLATKSAAEWVAAKPEKSFLVFRLPADQLARCVEGTIDAADPGAGQAALSGIRIACEDGSIAFVATDGRRLHVVEAEVDQAVDDCAITVPATAMRVVLQLCREAGDAAVQITRTTGEATFEIGDTTVTAGLLDGNYPRWKRVVREIAEPTTVAAAELLAAVRQAAVVTSEQSKGVAVKVQGTKCAIAARSSEHGTSTVAFRADTVGREAKVVVDPGYLAAWLRTVDPAGAVEVDFGDGSQSVALRHDTSTAIVMPLEGAFKEYEFADV